MRYSGINYNDTANGDGICVSFWTQGCPHKCIGCHNPGTWDFKGGFEKPIKDIIAEIIKAISANGIKRNFSILGGEPLCAENADNVSQIIDAVRTAYPDIKIFLWTGYEKNELNHCQREILNKTDYYIVGRFILELRDITLKWRGSSNQEIIRSDRNGRE